MNKCTTCEHKKYCETALTTKGEIVACPDYKEGKQ